LDRELPSPGLEELIDRHARFLLALKWAYGRKAKMWDDGAVKIIKRAVRNGNFSDPEEVTAGLCLFYPPPDRSNEENEEAADELGDYLEKYPLVKRLLDARWQGEYWQDAHGCPKPEYAVYCVKIINHFQDTAKDNRKRVHKSFDHNDFLRFIAKNFLPKDQRVKVLAEIPESSQHQSPANRGRAAVEDPTMMIW
jgi:hypothetical protein